MARLGVGRSLQRSLCIELEQTAAVFHRQWRRAFLAETAAHPAVVSRGNQKALRWPAMENKIESGRTEDGSGDEDGKAEHGGDDEWTSGHARLFCSDALRMERLQSLHAYFSALQGGDTFRGRSGGGERRNGRDASGDCGATDRFLVKEGVGTVRGVDNQLDA